MEIKDFDRNEPIPNYDNNVIGIMGKRLKKNTYHFNLMELGDSFLMPEDTKTSKRVWEAVRHWGIRHDKKFLKDYDSNQKLRCWRIL